MSTNRRMHNSNPSIQQNTTWQWKATSYSYLQKSGWNSKWLSWVKGTSLKKLQTVWFHLYDFPRRQNHSNKVMTTQSRGAGGKGLRRHSWREPVRVLRLLCALMVTCKAVHGGEALWRPRGQGSKLSLPWSRFNLWLGTWDPASQTACVYIHTHTCIYTNTHTYIEGFPGGSVSKKNLPTMQEIICNVGDPGLILGWGRSPGEGNVNQLQYSCL